MTEKENIFERIREALKTPAALPEHGSHAHEVSSHSPLAQSPRNWLPRVGDTFDERLALFQKNASDLKADFQLMTSFEEVSAFLEKFRDTEQWQRVASHSGEFTEAACQVLSLPVCRTDAAYDVLDLEKCDVGITECDSLVAQTGSVLVTSRSAGGRALSVLPPHHVVLARREQLLGDLSDAFELLKRKYSQNYPSFISFITGPSRTGDIERVLVLGAHGPRKLTILCW